MLFRSDVVTEKSIWVNESLSVSVDKSADKYYGYTLANRSTEPETLPTSYSSGGKSDNVIKVYYVKDDSQTKTVGYTVEYYKDGVHVTGDDVETE